MNIDELLAKFEKVEQKAPGNWTACCPAHGDSNPSLSITLKDDGKILLHCFTGCTVEEICASVGLKVSDLMPDRPAPLPLPAGKKKNLGRWVCDYIYEDPDGEKLYKIARFEKDDGCKTFVHMRPDASNKYGWAYGIHDKKTGKLQIKYRCPFRLPRVTAAAKAGKVIFILEGEKDVLNFEKATGCAATCNSGGALKWGEDFPADWGKWFQGAKGIVVIADNDPEFKTVVRKYRGEVTSKDMPHWKGQKHAADVRAKLIKAGFPAEKIKLMVMPPVGENKPKDFSDWAAARQAAGLPADRAAFQEAYNAAAPWPDAWNFSDEELSRAITDAARADKGARARPGENAGTQTSSGTPDQEEADMGRFGFAVTPHPDGVVKYAANIHLGRAGVFRIEVADNEKLHQCIQQECAKVAGKLNATGQKMSAKLANDTIALVCLLWMRARGKFFWREPDKRHATSMYFDQKSGILRNIQSDEFKSELSTSSGINRECTTFKYMMALLDDAAFSAEVSQGVKPSNLWECVNGEKIYISSGDGEMYRVTAAGVDKVQNCTDGVVFLRGKTLKPWTLQDGDGADPFVESMIFKGASFADTHGRMIVRLWFLNLFRNHEQKPPLLITGEYQSGKTRMAESIEEILGLEHVDKRSLKKGDKGEESFWLTMETKAITIFDNVDSRIDWIKDAMQIASTGGESAGRRLYTDDEEKEMRANAHIMITSNNPLFTSDEGLSDRMQTVNLNATRKSAASDSLSKDIKEHRNEYLTWAARLLSKALADKNPIENSINMRHPEFSNFGIRIGRAGGFEIEARAAMGFAELNKALLPLKNDESHIAPEILAVLLERGGVWEFHTNELVDAIIEHKKKAEEFDDKTEEYFNTRRVGKCLNKYWRILAIIFKAQPPRILHGKARYVFQGMTDGIGQLVGKVDKVDEVGVFCDSKKSSTKKQELETSGNYQNNPPNPPNTPLVDNLNEWDGGLADDADFDF